MSTYYYLVCHTHKIYCDGASRTVGGICHLADSDRLLPVFLVHHSEPQCKLESVSEYSMDRLYEQHYAELLVEDLPSLTLTVFTSPSADP